VSIKKDRPHKESCFTVQSDVSRTQKMDTPEAKTILNESLARYRIRSYTDLLKLLNRPEHFEAAGPSGKTYQVEVEVFWDAEPNGSLRVMGCIDDGGWRALAPITDSFIVDPAGKFIAE
jgi:hypothetical protein